MTEKEALFQGNTIHYQSNFLFRALLISFSLHVIILLAVTYWGKPDRQRPPEWDKNLLISLKKTESQQASAEGYSEKNLQQIIESDITERKEQEIEKLQEITTKHMPERPVARSERELPIALDSIPVETTRKEAPSKLSRSKLFTKQEKYGFPMISTTINCNQQQQKSEIVNCTKNDGTIWRNKNHSPYQGVFSKAFRHLNTTDGFKKDMAKRENLIRTQEQLYKMIAADAGESEFVMSERLKIASEISLIDKKYSSVDFLKIGKKVTEMLIEKSKE